MDDKHGNSPIWMHSVESNQDLWPLMQSRTRIKVGNGLKASLWNDKWIGNTPPDTGVSCIALYANNKKLQWLQCGPEKLGTYNSEDT